MAKLIATVTIEYGTEEQFLNKTYWYHSNKVNPYWASAYRHKTTIGDHLFYSDYISRMFLRSGGKYVSGFSTFPSSLLIGLPSGPSLLILLA